MFGSIQNTTRRGRRMMLWIVFLALYFIDNVLAEKPVDVILTHTPEGNKKTTGMGFYYQTDAGQQLKLKCAAKCPGCGAAMQYEFLRNGAALTGWAAWGEAAERNVAALDAATAGSYSCRARDGTSGTDVSEESPPLLLTLKDAATTVPIPGVAMTGVTAPIDAGSTTLTCAADPPVSPAEHQFVKTAPGPVKVMRKFEAGATYDLPFNAEATGTYGCMMLGPDGKIGISAAVEIELKCTDDPDCATGGHADPNAACTETPKRCTCKHGGFFSGNKHTCNVQPEKPTDLDGSTGVLTCAVANCGDGKAITDCTYKWFLDDQAITAETGETYTPTKNAKYKCQAMNGDIEGVMSKELTLTTLAKLSCITTVPDKTDDIACGTTEVKVICKECANAAGEEVMFVYLKNGTTDLPTSLPKKPNDWAANGLSKTTKIYGKQTYTCVTATTAAGGYKSVSVEKEVDCTVPGQDTTSQASGGVDTTSNGSGGNKGDDSGASDLGRPASVLTIVCSLLTLTLALRG